MKTVILITECRLTEKQARQFIKSGRRVAFPKGGVIGSFMDRPLVFTGGGIAEENDDLADIAKRFKAKGPQ